MADGGATYTVNIELATRQFSQDLRNLKNKIKNDLGKAVKIGGKQGTTTQQRAQQIREKRIENEEARKRFYNADKINAFRVRQGRITAENNKLAKIGLDVEKRQKDIGRSMEAAEEGRFQWAEAKLKVAKEQVKQDFKDLDLINKQAAAEKKAINDKAKEATRLENKARRGRYGQRMHGPIDRHGTQIYDGYKNPPIPKRGAALPIDLQRKGTGTFATSHTRLLRRRQNLETLLSTFEGISSPEIANFKKGIQGLVKQYGVVSTSMGQTRNAADFGNAGEIGRQLKELDNLTHREEQRAKRIQVTNKQEVEFLNKKHRIEKLLATFDKKGVATDAKRLKLERAITAQDKEQLKTLLHELELENIGLKGVSGKGGGRGGRGGRKSTIVGGPSSPLNFAANGQLLPGPKGLPLGRIASAAGISGGFPLLFGQSPGVAAISALGGGIGEAVTPGGGFAGGIVASALASKVAEVVQFRTEVSNLNKDMLSMGLSSEFSAGQIAKLGKALRVTKQEALEIAKGFKRYGGKRGGLFAEFFGDAQAFEATAGAIDIQSAIAAIKAQEKDMTPEQELRYRIMLQTQGVEETINALVEKRIKATREAFKEEQKNQRSREEARNLSYYTGMSYQRDSFTEQQQKDLDAQIEKEKELITQFEKERDLRNELALAAERQAQSINTAIESTEKELRKLNNAQYQVVQLANSISSAFSESFKGIVSGSMTAQDALRNLFQRRADHFLDMAAQMIAQQIKMKILGIGLNFLGSNTVPSGSFGSGSGTVGSGFGSAVDTNIGRHVAGHSSIQPMASGGPVSGGSPYLVGEKGPELFVPGSSGNIVPNHEMGGANVVVNVDASGSSVEGDAGAAQELGSMLAAAIQAELVKEKRPGGLLA